MGVNPELGVFGRRNLIHFVHKVTTSTSGTIASQDELADSGVLAAKTATKTGRYTLTVPSKYRKFHGGFATIVGADDTAYTTAKGLNSFLRDNDIDGGAADGTIELQFNRSDTAADAEVIDGAVFYVHLWVEF
jgi:hypothetical protein